jgi:hypothetical protein
MIFFLVWQYLLLQFSAASAILLQAVSGQNPGVQGAQQTPQGDASHLPGRLVPQHRHAEEESWLDRPKEVHCSLAQGKR